MPGKQGFNADVTGTKCLGKRSLAVVHINKHGRAYYRERSCLLLLAVGRNQLLKEGRQFVKMSAVRALDEDVTTCGLLLGDSLLYLVDIGEGAIWLLAIGC